MNDTFAKWALGILATLCAAGVLGGVKLYGDLREIQVKLETLAAESALDEQQSAQLSRLWQAAASNRDNLNRLREHVNGEHPDASPIPPLRWDISTP